MARPVVSDTAEELFAGLGPWARADGEATGWHLLKVCEAVCAYFDYVQSLSRDDDAGNLGWSVILDADRVPAEAVDYLGQFVGVAIPPGTSLVDARAYIKATGGFNRGSLASMQGAPGPWLTGTKTVVLKERTLSPYHLSVTTYLVETPDSAPVLAALIAQKPAGIVLAYTVQAGPIWDEVLAGTKWDDVNPALTWDQVANLLPGAL